VTLIGFASMGTAMKMRRGLKEGVSGRTAFAALALATALSLVASGCGKASAPAKVATPSAHPKNAAKTVIQEGTKGPQKVAYHYDPTNKPDPFRPFILLQKKSEAAISPLQKYDLGQITLKAVVWGVEQPRAMVEDPTGKGYVIQIGTDIGKNNGKVIKIDDREVVVRETYVDYTGHETKKDVALKIVTSNGEEG
jgi:type IV pilus assembly protein PilP